jgi:hypothetical protein
MGPGLTIVIAFAAAVGLIALAVWVWQRGQATEQASSQKGNKPAPGPVASKGASSSQPSVDERTQQVAPGFYPAPAEISQSAPPPAQVDEPTQSVPPPPPPDEPTQSIPPPFSTEVVEREEIEALVAQRRGQLNATAQPTPVPARTEVLPRPASTARTEVLPRSTPPASTEVLPKPAFEDSPPAGSPEPAPTVVEPQREPAKPSKPIEFRSDPPVSQSESRLPIPAPPKEFEIPRAPPPSISAEILTEHFEAALRVFGPMLGLEGHGDLAARVQGPELEWRQHVEVLALTAERAANELIWPTLVDTSAPSARRKAAALMLLELEAAKGHERLLERFAELDEVGREAAILGLTLWNSPRAETTALKGWQAADGIEQQMLWLRVFIERAADPGPAVILKATEPELLAIGLSLLPFHAQGREHAARIDRHILTGKPAVRMAAVRAGLTFERPAPWLACKQASRDPALPEICLLYAMLAPAKELETLSTWAKQPAAPAHAGWALGVSGRRVGIEACLDRLDHADPDVAAKALAGFQHATGYKGSRSASAARDWWKANEARFAGDKRHLHSELLTLASARRMLATGSRESRDALRLELLVRSGGRVRLPGVALPSREQKLLEELDRAEIDLARAWGTPK